MASSSSTPRHQPEERTPALIAFEEEILRKLNLVRVIHESLLPSFLVSDRDELSLRACSSLTRIAYRGHLRNLVRERAALGDPEALEFKRTCRW